MNSLHRSALGATLAVAAIACFGRIGGAVAQDSPARGNAENGKRLYYEHGCYGCHGFNGETGARNLVGTGSPLIADEATFIQYLRLRADQAPLLPTTRMPNYPEAALSDSEARDIYAYIRTFELDAPDVESVPTLQAIIESAARPYEP